MPTPSFVLITLIAGVAGGALGFWMEVPERTPPEWIGVGQIADVPHDGEPHRRLVVAPRWDGWRRFSALDAERRGAVLEGWRRSRWFARRLVFTSLRAIVTQAYFADPAVLRALPSIWKRRQRVQALRRVPDRALLSMLDTALPRGLGTDPPRLMRLADRFFSAYAAALRAIVRW